jgi:hypothetical protein
MSSRNKTDPNDWARKRKVVVYFESQTTIMLITYHIRRPLIEPNSFAKNGKAEMSILMKITHSSPK